MKIIKKRNTGNISGIGIHLVITAAIWLLIFSPLFSQDFPDSTLLSVLEKAEKSYGPDPLLVSGEKYYYPYRSALGTPFLEHKDSDHALVKINGKTYRDQRIRYDLYNQLMVLEFKDGSGAFSSIILPLKLLEGVTIGDLVFKKFPMADGSVRIGQVLYEGWISCVCFWEKKYQFELYGGKQSFYFTDPERKRYVYMKGELFPLRGKRSLLNILPDEMRSRVKSYLKKHRIRLRRASDKEIGSVMEFMNAYMD